MILETLPSYEDEEDFIFKIIVVGESGTGKTNMLTKFVNDEFNECSVSTVGMKLLTKTYIIDKKVVKMQLWDTAGQERFKSITTNYFKGAKGAMIVYDITNPGSFSAVDFWNEAIKATADKDITIMLAGNKSDKINDRVIDMDKGIRKAKDLGKSVYNYKIGLAFFETSALNGSNIEKAFKSLIIGNNFLVNKERFIQNLIRR